MEGEKGEERRRGKNRYRDTGEGEKMKREKIEKKRNRRTD